MRDPRTTDTGPERRWLIWMLVSFTTVAAVAYLASVLLAGELRRFDEALLLALRQPGDRSMAIGPVWLPQVMRDFTAFGGVAVLTVLTLAVAGFLVLQGKRHAAAFVVVSTASGIALSHALKLGFARPRPDLVPHGVDVYTHSFPSGHAMLSAAVYLTLGALLSRTSTDRRLKAYVLALCTALTLLVGASRIYLGVHWPTDVIAGWAMGAAWAMLCWVVMSRLQSAGSVEPASGAPADREVTPPQ
jgi:undecaprenyl-diphosphatase